MSMPHSGALAGSPRMSPAGSATPPTHMPVDWAFAAKVGSRLVRPGHAGEREDMVALVTNLRDAAERSVGHVLQVTQMVPADGRDLTTAPLSTVHVVDRARWVEANTEVMAAMLSPAPSVPSTSMDPASTAVPAVLTDAPVRRVMTHTDATGHLIGGAQVGAALSMIAPKVLGQLDPYASPSPGTGRLLLVAPNILAVQESLKLSAPDFQLWVCLHEQTHALQFAAAPWLADHMMRGSQELLEQLTSTGKDLTHGTLAERGTAAAKAAFNFVRGELKMPLMDRFLTPHQRTLMADLGAVMALLEGHADVVMDAVGPRVVPTVRAIRKAFNARRDTVSGRDFVVRKVLGMDAKMAQYRDGAAFVRAVRRRGGWEMLNTVWTGPTHLPSAREIADPHAWIRRVHG